MITGLRGRLVSAAFASTTLQTLPGMAPPTLSAQRALDAWSERRDTCVGPASSVRAITDVVVIPLLRLLGFSRLERRDSTAWTMLGASGEEGAVVVPVLVTPWSESLDRAWRGLVIQGLRSDARWCFCFNGTVMRVVDAHRTWSRHYLEFDLALLASEAPLRNVFWSLTRADAVSADRSLLDRATSLSQRHGAAVCKSLGDGVVGALQTLFAALSQSRTCPSLLLEQALTVLYRILFLLFAEARGLVPLWHPVYRDKYSLDRIVSELLTERRHRGVWQAILAISRLAHAGCSVQGLAVTAFNSRLFSPAHTPALTRIRVPDGAISEAVMAVSTTKTPTGRTRISYADLDVEQLGAVYERVLEYEPTPHKALALSRTRDVRRASGTFYTPRTVTHFLVHRTLEPLVREKTVDEILNLRILDPAMGSGAFLVASCRYLASVVEDRLIQEGRWHSGDVSAADRAAVRREIAQRCLFGVDVNPMAVQLARLSLWLATLARDKPLTFLDHHLVAGDSLVGTTIEAVMRRPYGGGARAWREQRLPLFEETDPSSTLESVARTRSQLSSDPDDTVAIVAAKERMLAGLSEPRSPLGRWSAVLDLWCAGWFWEHGKAPGRALFGDLCKSLLGGVSSLPSRVSEPILRHSAELSARHRFLHWPLAFPEVFPASQQGGRAGFDAVLGNPPWDMIRGDSGEADTRAARRHDAKRLVAFVRDAGVYNVRNRGHINRYQVFVERAQQLTRHGGRLGLVLPTGIISDAGAAPLRQHLFDHTDIDSVTGLDNRAGIFPIHRSLRFVLMTGTTGRRTTAPMCRFGITSSEDLDCEAASRRIVLSTALLTRISGSDDLGMPEINTERDLGILERISARFPRLGSREGWGVSFGRELNATDDRARMVAFRGNPSARPVLEGKQIEPFRASVDRAKYELRNRSRHVVRRARLVYRDVASARNRLTLIAAIVPSRAVTTHTLFCLKTRLPVRTQRVLCALMNSLVANYLIRFRVNTHVTVALVSHLPAPVVTPTSPLFAALDTLVQRLSDGQTPVEEMPEYSLLQAMLARLYELSEEDFEHVLSTFPLISPDVRAKTLDAFRRLCDQ